MSGEQRFVFSWQGYTWNNRLCASYLETTVVSSSSFYKENINYHYQGMIALDSSEQPGCRRETNKNRDEAKKTSEYERAKSRYGLSIVYIDDNSVHVGDIFGRQVAFEFPFHDTGLDQYDAFIQKLQDKSASLPPIEEVVLTVKRPLADVLRKPIPREGSNSPTKLGTLEQIAQQHGLTTDEMKWMYHLAREGLYERFRSRLRR